ncbi:HD-GYP domain-containing protein [Oceanibaculum pacificum]|uniref:HD-GYP domain-containing protein n=1 Tax=Oceanibaculum pacificum TaxID=580166 RepID=A0A154VZW5_9PROT|nr:HD domain-containing phosphohydrolase [Oceanibaculum pacificum]KZD06777.1 hypothetical protein AUP43_10585 [Oceanibaculum pacificum]
MQATSNGGNAGPARHPSAIDIHDCAHRIMLDFEIAIDELSAHSKLSTLQMGFLTDLLDQIRLDGLACGQAGDCPGRRFNGSPACLTTANAARLMSWRRHLEFAEMAGLDRPTLQGMFGHRSAMFIAMLDTATHEERVGDLAWHLARDIGLNEHDAATAALGACYHDIGKICIDRGLIDKPGALTADESSAVSLHTLHGASLLQHCDHPVAATVRLVVRHHHETMDGSGYPAGLSGQNIPIEARLCAVADIFDALISDRPYRAGLSTAQSWEIIERAQSKFDPEILKALKHRIDNPGEIR